jgi:predicted membrane-bound spermidine synthase/tetratricopeptide (TPR) repeat protein
MTASAPNRAARGLLFAAIFASGLAGLMHEIVWSKMLVSLIGSTAHAQVAVLAVFMIGLAIGSVLFGRHSDHRARPLETYARLEVLIAAYGLLLPFVVRAAGAGYEALAPRFFEQGAWLFSLRFLLAVLCVLLPAIWMGGTLPILARFLVVRVESTRGAVARLYALNNLGAVLGAGLAGFWTLSAFGILPSLVLASLMNVLAAFLALRAQARALRDAAPAPRREPPTPAAAAAGPIYTRAQYTATLLALFASGFAAMGYEVLFTRVIALSFGSSTYSFTVMLMSFITGIGIGSAIVSLVRVERPLWLFGASQLAAVAALVAMTPLVSRLPYWTGLLRIELGTEGLAFTYDQVAKAGMILLFLLVPTVCLGFGFPLVSAIQARSPARIGSAVGSTYAWNTVGNVVGTVATGLWILPALGVLGAFHVQLAMNLAAGALVVAVAVEVPLVRRAGAAAAALAALAVYALFGAAWVDPINRSADHLRLRTGPDPSEPAWIRASHPASSFESWKLAYVKRPEDYSRYFFAEDANATVLTYGDEDGVTLTVNTKPDATSFTDPQRSDISTQMLLAHLPLLFARDSKSVLVIGHGSGITAGSAMLHVSERGDVVEISRGVLASDALFVEKNHQVLSDRRVRVWQEDGRTFMRTAPWTYDAIISEPSNPWIAGIGGLFTRECFEEARARLAPGGVLCLWFHEYEQEDESIQLVLRTVAAVFPHAMVFQVLQDGDVIVLAGEAPLEPDFARMEERFDRPELRRDFARMRAYNLATLLVFHAIPESAYAALSGSGPINTDDHQRLESMAATAFFRNSTSRLVWRNHCLNRAPSAPGESLLDRYARWREQQGDPLSKEELEAAVRRVQMSLDAESGRPMFEALAARVARATARAAPASLAARGGVPDLATMDQAEANDRGADLFHAGDTDRAIECWKRAIEADPSIVNAYANLAAGLQQKGDVPAALAALEEGIARSPRKAFLRLIAAQLLEAAGDTARAQAFLAAAVEVEPENVDAWTRLGTLLFQANEPARAAQCFERALALQPTSWQHAADLAQILTRVPGGRGRAMQVVQTALSYYPGEPELQRVLAMVQGSQTP